LREEIQIRNVQSIACEENKSGGGEESLASLDATGPITALA
jgi:hypothetical protein